MQYNNHHDNNNSPYPPPRSRARNMRPVSAAAAAQPGDSSLALVGLGLVVVMAISLCFYSYYYYVDAAALLLFAFIVILLAVPFFIHDAWETEQGTVARWRAAAHDHDDEGPPRRCACPLRGGQRRWLAAADEEAPIFIPVSYVQPVNRYII